MKIVTKATLGIVGVAAFALAPAMPAHADTSAQTNDIVGVGSDTLQYISDFIAEGDANGDSGYNATHLGNRLVNFDATGDAFGALTNVPIYGSTSTRDAGIVERSGTLPVLRPDGSGSGYDALNADATGVISYVRASSAASTARQNTATANFGGFHAYEVATDDVQIAVSSTNGSVPTDVPTNLTAAELKTIYTSQPATAGNLSTCPTFSSEINRGPAEVAHPVLPQSGSGTRSSFETAIGITDSQVGACVAIVQEHDPAPIQGDDDALGPFSVGRYNLINSGYFKNVNILANAVALQGNGFPSARPLYIVTRFKDLTDSNGNVIGLPLATIVAALFKSSTGAYVKNSATALYTAAGFTKKFQDCVTANTFCS